MTDYVVFGEDWGRHPSSTQHLIRHIAKNNRVLWINSIGLRRPNLNAADIKRAANKLASMTGRGAPAAKQAPVDTPRNLRVFSAKAIPWPGSKAMRRLNRRLVGSEVRAELKRLGMRNPVLWASLPSAVDVVGELGESAVVYYCGDDFGSLAGVDHEPVLDMERELVWKADLVFAASRHLMGKFPPRTARYLPHGVDYDLFSTPAERAADLPDGKPIAGFYGSLAEWIDAELLEATARALPDWNFVFVGQIERDQMSRFEALSKMSNVHILGPRPHDALPGYSQHWDVSMLPFCANQQIAACNPLKLREYLATGRPVVTTDFPALEGYRDLVRIAEGSDAYSEALCASTSEKKKAGKKRKRRVREEQWEHRARDVEAWIDSVIRTPA